MSVLQLLIAIAILGAGISTGLLFIFSNTVMPVLAKQDEMHSIRTMQAINDVIVNPLFVLFYMGTGIVSLVIFVLTLLGDRNPFLLAGAMTYVAGVVGLTMAYHVPRNNALDAVDAASDAGKAYWQRYQREWTRWNHVRAVAGGMATLLFALGLL